MDVAPCKNCDERRVGCHAVCRKYTAWKVDHEAFMKKVHMEKMLDGRSDWIRSGTLYHDKPVIRSRENERRRKDVELQRKKDERRMERARNCKED